MNIQRKRFRYFLMADASTYYYESGGIVSTTSTATPLRKDVMEWKDTNIQWKRHKKWHGVFRSYIVPMSFVKDGATILRDIYLDHGKEARCIFKVQKLNVTTQIYEDYYQGEIDFSQYRSTDRLVQASVLDAGLAALLKAKSNTMYEIPLYDSDSLKVYHDGVELRGNAHYVVPQQGQPGSAITFENTMVIAPAGSEGINEASTFATLSQNFPASVILDNSTIYTAKYAEVVTITATMNAFAFWPSAASSNVKFTLAVRVGFPGGSITDHKLFTDTNFLSPGQNRSFNITPASATLSVPLAAGESVGVFVAMLDASDVSQVHISSRFMVTDDLGFIDISSEYTRPATVVKWKRQYTVFQELIEQIGGGLYTAASSHMSNAGASYYDSKPYNVLMTSGDALRGLGDGSGGAGAVPAKIKISLDELTKDGESREMTGLGVDGDTVRIERLPYFYDDSTVLIHLGLIADLEIADAPEYQWNNLKIGYRYRENEALNGKNDPFLTHEYTSIGIRQPAEKDAISPFVASFISQEYVRANLGGKKTTDSGNDNDTFLIEVSGNLTPNGEHIIRRDHVLTGNSYSGLIAGDSAYNLSLTPKRNFYRNGADIRVGVSQMDSSNLTFQTADQNAEVTSKLSAGVGLIVEKSPVAISSLPALLYYPKYFRFRGKVPPELPAVLTANPYGKITFDWINPRTGIQITLGGFVSEAGIKDGDKSAYQFELIASPTTDLNALKH